MNLVFASANKHKITEVRKLLGDSFPLVSLKELGAEDELPETGNTLEKNASQKARYVYEKFGMNCFADDTGLEIEALDGRPGIYSARYAGAGKSAADNMQKVLSEMRNTMNRKACFRTMISLIIDGEEKFFEGKINGVILHSLQGREGFGYDPIFQPDGYSGSFAEMPLADKNKISHRAKAVLAMKEYLLNGKS